MKQLTKRLGLSALGTLVFIPSLASADLFQAVINADSLGRVGAGVANIGGNAAVLENPAGLPGKFLIDRYEDIEGSFEFSVGMGQAIELGNSKNNEDEFFTSAPAFNFSGGVHLATEGWGWSLASGFFGSDIRDVPEDKDQVSGIDYDGKKPIQTQYYGFGYGLNLLPNEWPVNFRLGASYILLPKSGKALILGAQTRLIDTTRHTISLGATQRSFKHDNVVKLSETYRSFKKASIDLPEQTSIGASWLIKGYENSFGLAVDVKETDYSEVLHLKDYGRSEIKSWTPELYNLGIYNSQHASLTWYSEESGSWTLGYSQGRSDTANLDSKTLGISVESRHFGLGVQHQILETDSKSQSITSLILTFRPSLEGE